MSNDLTSETLLEFRFPFGLVGPSWTDVSEKLVLRTLLENTFSFCWAASLSSNSEERASEPLFVDDFEGLKLGKCVDEPLPSPFSGSGGALRKMETQN